MNDTTDVYLVKLNDIPYTLRENTSSQSLCLEYSHCSFSKDDFTCDLHVTHMPTQSITSQLPLQVSYSEKRKQTIVRVREVRNEQQLCMDPTISLSPVQRQGPSQEYGT